MLLVEIFCTVLIAADSLPVPIKEIHVKYIGNTRNILTRNFRKDNVSKYIIIIMRNTIIIMI